MSELAYSLFGLSIVATFAWPKSVLIIGCVGLTILVCAVIVAVVIERLATGCKRPQPRVREAEGVARRAS